MDARKPDDCFFFFRFAIPFLAKRPSCNSRVTVAAFSRDVMRSMRISLIAAQLYASSLLLLRDMEKDLVG